MGTPAPEPHEGDLILPGPAGQPALAADQFVESLFDRLKAERLLGKRTTTDQLRDRIEDQISGLKSDKTALQAEVDRLRSTEIPYWQESSRWFADRLAEMDARLAALTTSYEWAVAFSWFSFASITIGGCGVSFASFLPAPATLAETDQRLVVTVGSTIILLGGVLIQGVVAYRGLTPAIKAPERGHPPKRPASNQSDAPSTPAAR